MYYPGEKEILEFLKKKQSASMEDISKECSLNPDSVRRAIESLRGKELVAIEKKNTESYLFSREFESLYLSKSFPENKILEKANSGKTLSSLDDFEKSFGLGYAIRKRMVRLDGEKLVATGSEFSPKIDLKNPSSLPKELIDEFLKRKFLAKQATSSSIVLITRKGMDSRMDEDSFSVNVRTKDAPIGKTHPLSRAINNMKEIFVQMGFEEMEGKYVESTFWNFDALFQPQDHPARELADTFYVEHSFDLPDNKLLNKVKKSHEKGWKYKWRKDEAKKAILRTHTTCLSARYLNALKEPYKKYFAVGRVFRNEATDFKHLSEFHQVEGIIAWKNATFCDLLGVLKEFYKKLGFEKIRFRPSYFPYTEPSLEIEVFYEPRKQWMELGGAGIFRPEVTKPITKIYPVLAWGLSLERPLMIKLGLDDIRTFYKNDLDWLKNSRVKE